MSQPSLGTLSIDGHSVRRVDTPPNQRIGEGGIRPYGRTSRSFVWTGVHHLPFRLRIELTVSVLSERDRRTVRTLVSKKTPEERVPRTRRSVTFTFTVQV